jgi:hypothetical protein
MRSESENVEPVKGARDPMWYAVVCGTNYLGSSAQLAGCENDVETNVQLHRDLGAQVEVLKGGQATKVAILSTLAEALKGAGPNDGVELSWSGHGTNARDRDGDETDRLDEAICPDDFQRSGVIIDDQLYELAAPAFARGVRVVFKLDSCNSGKFHRQTLNVDDQGIQVATRFFPPGWLPPEIRPDPAADRTPRAKVRPGALAFSACRENQLAQEYPVDGKVQGAFTYHSTVALYRLLQEHGEGRVNYRDWCREAVALVNDPDQVPMVDGTVAQKRSLVGKERGRR